MKKLIPCLHVFALILIINNGPLFAQRKNDTLQIKETVLNYLEGLDTNDPDRVAKAMHPDFAKRTSSKSRFIIHVSF